MGEQCYYYIFCYFFLFIIEQHLNPIQHDKITIKILATLFPSLSVRQAKYLQICKMVLICVKNCTVMSHFKLLIFVNAIQTAVYVICILSFVYRINICLFRNQNESLKFVVSNSNMKLTRKFKRCIGRSCGGGKIIYFYIVNQEIFRPSFFPNFCNQYTSQSFKFAIFPQIIV